METGKRSQNNSDELVSVIIPVHNSERYLTRAVNSVLHQTWRHLEIILVDDGSDGRTRELVDRLADQAARPVDVNTDDKLDRAVVDWRISDQGITVKAIHLPEDQGVSVARNKGLEQAQGDYVTFLDDDDAMDPFLVEELLRVMEQTGADISGCLFKKVPVHTLYEDAQTMEPAAALTSGNGTVRNYTGTEIVAQAILTEHDTRVWSKLFTRKILQGHTFKEGLSIGEDMLFFLSLIDRNSKYSLLEKELYLYTVNPDGAMEKPFVPSHMDQLRCWELAGEMIMRHFPDLLATGDNAAKLAAVSLVSAILTASKIARLPRTVTFSADSPQNSSVSLSSAEADRLFAICREHALKYSKVPGVHQYLPQGYRQKEFLLLHMPGVYRRIYQKRVGNFR